MSEAWANAADAFREGKYPGTVLLRLAVAGITPDDPDFAAKADAVVKVLEAGATIESTERRRHKRPVKPEATGWVYYMRIRDTVKIGFTTAAPRVRQQQLRADEILAVEPGGRDLEAARHDMFHRHRLPHLGRERYLACPAIDKHIESVRARFPELNREYVITVRRVG